VFPYPSRIANWFVTFLALVGDIGVRLGSLTEALRDDTIALRNLLDLKIDVPPPTEDPRIAALAAKIEDLTLAVGEGIQRVRRTENRVRAVVDGARRELADAGFASSGVEAEATELELIDGGESAPEPVLEVPADVGVSPETPSSVPGVTVEQLRRAITG